MSPRAKLLADFVAGLTLLRNDQALALAAELEEMVDEESNPDEINKLFNLAAATVRAAKGVKGSKPRTARPKFELGDGLALHAANPETFEIPPDSVKKRLRIGTFVKLLFSPIPAPKAGPRSERMWVVITVINADSTFVGTLSNDPVITKGLKDKDVVTFEARHIISVLWKEKM